MTREEMAQALIRYAHFDGQMAGLEFEAIAAELRKMDWQPIETAPKDGTFVLAVDVYDIRNGRPHMCVARRSTRTKYWLSYPGAWAFTPTHWTPIVPPPNTEGGE